MKGTNCCEASEKKKSVNLYFAKLSLKESLVLIVLFGVGYSSEVDDKKKGREGGKGKREGKLHIAGIRSESTFENLAGVLSTLFLRELARLRDKLSISTRWVRVPHKEKARLSLPPSLPRDKAILPVFESSIIGAGALSCLIFSRYREANGRATVQAVRRPRETPEELLVYGRRYRSYRAPGNGPLV